MLDATVAYARVRSQFGRPIGSFQAVKHACADMLVQVCVSRELAAAAVQLLSGDGPEIPAARPLQGKSRSQRPPVCRTEVSLRPNRASEIPASWDGSQAKFGKSPPLLSEVLAMEPPA